LWEARVKLSGGKRKRGFEVERGVGRKIWGGDKVDVDVEVKGKWMRQWRWVG